MSLIFIAATFDRVRTRLVVRSQATSGTLTRESPAKFSANRSGARRLVEVVDLFEARLRELLDESADVDALRDDAHLAQPSRRAAKRREINGDDLVDARALHFDDDLAEPGVGRLEFRETGSVRLPEGCRRDGRFIEPGIGPFERHTEFGFGELLDRVKRHRGHFILQIGEFRRDLGREDVHARGEELADLDHEAAELDGERAEPSGETPRARLAGTLRERLEADPREEQLVHQICTSCRAAKRRMRR